MLEAQIESLLFVSGKPLSIITLMDILNKDKIDIETAIDNLINNYYQNRGIILIKNGDYLQLVSSPEYANIVKQIIKKPTTENELTKSSLETLTIIAYRGPLTKAEIEQIRGINSSLIIRNLLIKAFIEKEEKNGEIFYKISNEFLHHLKVKNLNELPDYNELNNSLEIENILEILKESNNAE